MFALVVVGLGVALFWGVRSAERAALWRSGPLLLADAASHYPDGVSASLLAARRAAFAGDASAAVSALRRAEARGYNRFDQLATDPALAPLRDDPAFQALLRDLAAGWIERSREKSGPTQAELRMVAQAHIVRGELRSALAVLERALSVGGAADEVVRQEIEALRTAIERGR